MFFLIRWNRRKLDRSKSQHHLTRPPSQRLLPSLTMKLPWTSTPLLAQHKVGWEYNSEFHLNNPNYQELLQQRPTQGSTRGRGVASTWAGVKGSMGSMAATAMLGTTWAAFSLSRWVVLCKEMKVRTIRKAVMELRRAQYGWFRVNVSGGKSE